MKKVEGTIQRSGRYHANVRIPAALQQAYGKEMYRESLKTSDPVLAAQRVNMIRATLDAEREKAERERDLARLTASLEPDQKRLYKEAGGLSGLLKRFEAGSRRRPS